MNEETQIDELLEQPIADIETTQETTEIVDQAPEVSVEVEDVKPEAKVAKLKKEAKPKKEDKEDKEEVKTEDKAVKLGKKLYVPGTLSPAEIKKLKGEWGASKLKNLGLI
jgi:hypothetical protein